MPELPEVETFMQIAADQLSGRTITGFKALNDPIVFSSPSAVRKISRLGPCRLIDVGRKGKYGWLTLDSGQNLIFHFGMTGCFEPYNDTPPRFTRLQVHCGAGPHLSFVNKRRLGRVYLADNPFEHPKISQLGFDALDELPSPRRFVELLGKRKAPIKAVLLDQKVLAGIGNWIADEVLYQAGIRPDRPANQLADGELLELRRALRRILRLAVRVQADDTRFPSKWLFHRRWGRQKEACSHDGLPLAFASVGGRTTAWVPGQQI